MDAAIRCFLCGDSISLPERVVVTGHVQHSSEPSAEPATLRLHPGCATQLAGELLVGLKPTPLRSPEEPEPGRIAGLTRWEATILGRLVRGETNRQIGRHVGATEKTVKQAVSIILDKLDAQSRTEAAAIAVRYGLVEYPPQ